MYRIFIVEDHAVMLNTYRMLLDAESDMEVFGSAQTGSEALQRIPEVSLDLDLVIVDLSLPDINGIDLMRQLRTQHPDLTMLVVSGQQAHHYRKLIEQEGAKGYVDKVDLFSALIPTIRQVLQPK